jgi:hypothetical protein
MRFLAVLALVPLLAAAALGKDVARRDWPLYQKGVRWVRSLDDARALAREQKKLVFQYRLVGDMDAAEC